MCIRPSDSRRLPWTLKPCSDVVFEVFVNTAELLFPDDATEEFMFGVLGVVVIVEEAGDEAVEDADAGGGSGGGDDAVADDNMYSRSNLAASVDRPVSSRLTTCNRGCDCSNGAQAAMPLVPMALCDRSTATSCLYRPMEDASDDRERNASSADKLARISARITVCRHCLRARVSRSGPATLTAASPNEQPDRTMVRYGLAARGRSRRVASLRVSTWRWGLSRVKMGAGPRNVADGGGCVMDDGSSRNDRRDTDVDADAAGKHAGGGPVAARRGDDVGG